MLAFIGSDTVQSPISGLSQELYRDTIFHSYQPVLVSDIFFPIGFTGLGLHSVSFPFLVLHGLDTL